MGSYCSRHADKLKLFQLGVIQLTKLTIKITLKIFISYLNYSKRKALHNNSTILHPHVMYSFMYSLMDIYMYQLYNKI